MGRVKTGSLEDWAEWDGLMQKWVDLYQRGSITDLEFWRAINYLGVDNKHSEIFGGIWLMDGNLLVYPAHWQMSPNGREITRID